MAAAAATPGIHYAPDDPTLPPPWKALVDGNTGYIYYWNTETNVTQYERPLSAPLQSGPPLPVGPPPGSTPPAQLHAVPHHAQNGGSVEMNGAISNSLPDGSSVNSLNPVNTATSGQSVHGMSNGLIHPASVAGNAQSNLHVNPGMMVPGNMYGNYNNNPPGQGGGVHMTGSAPGGGHMMGNTPGVNHGTARSVPGMSGAPMHMNAADNSFGGGGRSTHSGALGGVPPRVMNMHAASIRSMQSGVGVNAPMQPKLAVLPVPQRQQAMGGMQTSVQSRQMIHHGNSGGPIPAGPGPFKRPGNDFANVEPEPLKRPRMQGFPESTPLMDVDSYRRQHEITVMGDNIPPPIMTFESASFSPELAREVRYLLQTGAYVVRCAAATAESQHTAVILWGLHPCGLSARDIVPFMDYPVA